VLALAYLEAFSPPVLQYMKTRYNAVTRWVHWLTALLVAATFVLGPEDLDEAENLGGDWSVQVHETLGLIVFSLSIFRIAWMLFAQPRLDIPMSTLMSISAKTIQATLYFLLLAVPLTAVFGIWLNGDALNLLGNTTITVPIGTMEKAGELLLDLHSVLADLLMWLAGVHAGAALFHHYILKDTVLKSMMSK
jgi:cytochrome b561